MPTYRYDSDHAGADIATQDFIGYVETTMGRIMGADLGKFIDIRHDSHSHARGTLQIEAEEVTQNNGIIKMQFSASHVDKKDLFGKSDPFLVLSHQNTDGSFSTFHKTEVGCRERGI